MMSIIVEYFSSKSLVIETDSCRFFPAPPTAAPLYQSLNNSSVTEDYPQQLWI